MRRLQQAQCTSGQLLIRQGQQESNGSRQTAARVPILYDTKVNPLPVAESLSSAGNIATAGMYQRPAAVQK